MKRICWIAVVSGAILASLLVFPSSVPWMIFAWIVLYSIAVMRNQSGWAPLVICSLVVVVKRLAWPPSLIALFMLMAFSGSALAICKFKEITPSQRIKRTSLALLWIFWGWFTAEFNSNTRSEQILQLESRPVVCLGDSLTAFGYPQELAERLTVSVIDLSINGCTTSDALQLMGRLTEAKPQTVIIELGGNDFLMGHSREATANNIREIISVCQACDATIVLMEIPRGFVIDPFSGLERELAREFDLELISDTPIRNLVLWSPYSPPGMWCNSSTHLSDDGLHPNSQGNAYLADRVASRLIRIYGSEIGK